MFYIIPALFIFLTLIFLGLGVVYLNWGQVRQQELQMKLQTASGNLKVSRNKAMKMTFNERVVIPLAQRVYNVIQSYVPTSSQYWIKTKLIHAGYQKPQHVRIFVGVQCLLASLLFGFFTFYGTFFSQTNAFVTAFAAVMFGIIGFFLPVLWLVQQASIRQTRIRRSLPDFLDLLVICVEAGMGLDMAINKIAQLKRKSQMKELQTELGIYIKDIGLGKPRQQALMELTERTGVDDLNSLITALAQSFEMGASIAQILRVHSDGLRVKRLEMAKEKANKIPVKMVLPIYIFLFPSIFIAIFGPIVMVLIKTVLKAFMDQGMI